MTDIATRRINSYTIEFEIEDKTFTLTDLNVKNQIEARHRGRRAEQYCKKLKKISKLSKLAKTAVTISALVGAIGFFYAVGIVGHSDYCTEVKMIDDWSNTTYMLHTACSIIIMLISFLIYKIGSYFNKLKINIKESL